MDKIAKFALIAKYYCSEEMKETVMAGHVAGVEKPENLKRRKRLGNMDRDVRMTFKLILISYNKKY